MRGAGCMARPTARGSPKARTATRARPAQTFRLQSKLLSAHWSLHGYAALPTWPPLIPASVSQHLCVSRQLDCELPGTWGLLSRAPAPKGAIVHASK